jgi:hypothetical protein
LQLGLADANLHRKQREKRRKIQPPRGKVMASSSAQLASSSYKPTNFATETSELIAFCNVPIGRLSSGNFAEEAAGTFPDLDTGLEWMEEKALGRRIHDRPPISPSRLKARGLSGTSTPPRSQR